MGVPGVSDCKDFSYNEGDPGSTPESGRSLGERNGNPLQYSCLENEKRWQDYTEELYKKGLNDLDNHDCVVIHLEPGILECEVEWVLGSITMNKASGGLAELFQILKDDAVEVLHSVCQQVWKT